MNPEHPSLSLFSIRLWVGDRLYELAAWVMPEHRYESDYSEGCERFHIWREPA